MLPVHTILFPTDFSENARQAFPLACSLARDCGARVVALHVTTPTNDPNPLLALEGRDEYYQAPLHELHALKAPNANVHVEYQLEFGKPGSEIMRVARQINAGLIVLGARGRTGVRRLLLGSVAEQVLRDAECPVLLVKQGLAPPKIETILLPTDLSEASESALGIAFSLARDYRARLIALHVTSAENTLPHGAFERMFIESPGYQHALEDKACRCVPGCKVEFQVAHGEPEEQILRVARENRSDLIVMGTHGRTGLKRLIMGSVAEKTLRDPACPVLLVKHSAVGIEAWPESMECSA